MEFAARMDPDFMESYNNLYRVALNGGKHLPAKTKELVAICLLSFKGDIGSTTTHIKRAMRLGATKEEIFEALEASICPGGASTFYSGLTALMKALEEMNMK